jgi:hypothetical protein
LAGERLSGLKSLAFRGYGELELRFAFSLAANFSWPFSAGAHDFDFLRPAIAPASMVVFAAFSFAFRLLKSLMILSSL